MKPSAKRALLLPAWLERKLYWQVAGLFRAVACNRIRGCGRAAWGRAQMLDAHFQARRGLAAVRMVGRGVDTGVSVAAWETVRLVEGRGGAAMTEATGAQQA